MQTERYVDPRCAILTNLLFTATKCPDTRSHGFLSVGHGQRWDHADVLEPDLASFIGCYCQHPQFALTLNPINLDLDT